MKWTKDGVVFEGTVAEYLEMMGQVKVENVPKAIVPVPDGGYYKRFTDAEKKIIIDNPKLNSRELQKLLPYRSRKSLWMWQRELIKNPIIKSEHKPEHYTHLTSAEKKIIMDNPTMNSRELQTLLPNRSPSTLLNWQKRLAKKPIIQESLKRYHRHSKNVSWNAELDDKVVSLKREGRNLRSIAKALSGIVGHKLKSSVVSNRLNQLGRAGVSVSLDTHAQERGRMGHFIKSRAKYLMNQYNYDYEKARNMAHNEWGARAGSIPNVKVQTPLLYELVKITEDDERKVVNVYTNRADAESMREECVQASQMIQERAVYLIIKKSD